MVNLESDCLELGPSWSRCDLWCFWAAAFNSWCFHYDPFPLPWCLATHQLTVWWTRTFTGHWIFKVVSYCCMPNWWISLLTQVSEETQGLPSSVLPSVFILVFIVTLYCHGGCLWLQEPFQHSEQESAVNRSGIRCGLLYIRKDLKGFSGDILLCLLGPEHGVKRPPWIRREVWTWAQCNPSRNWEGVEKCCRAGNCQPAITAWSPQDKFLFPN